MDFFPSFLKVQEGGYNTGIYNIFLYIYFFFSLHMQKIRASQVGSIGGVNLVVDEKLREYDVNHISWLESCLWLFWRSFINQYRDQV